jgi:DNA-3-methyladenine glycosylase I
VLAAAVVATVVAAVAVVVADESSSSPQPVSARTRVSAQVAKVSRIGNPLWGMAIVISRHDVHVVRVRAPESAGGDRERVGGRSGPYGGVMDERCWWAMGAPEYEAYHDREWGFPVTDDVRLFEKLCLEGFQSGLSWLTILRKREHFRAAFSGFRPEVVAAFDDADVARLLADAGIVRHRGKIESTINNARRYLELVEREGSLAAYVWSFEPDPATRPAVVTKDTIASTSPSSVAMAKDLKKRRWTFVGPTTVYAFQQAMGLVDDHLSTCPTRAEVEAARATVQRPGRR